MEAKHTPGPWKTNTAGGAKKGEPFKITEIYVYAPNTQDDTAICADGIDPGTQEPSEANARLIAAAPDLLEALEEALPMVPCGSFSDEKLTELAEGGHLTAAMILRHRAAIASVKDAA